MELINAELAALNNSIQSPIYSWVTPFKNFITPGGVWKDDCGSEYASILPFDDQMRLFTQIEVDSTCCQKYGICGEQYSLDIIFDDEGKVEATRFRFQHQPMRYQVDYINALVETRKSTDVFTKRLKSLNSTTSVTMQVKHEKQKSMLQKFKEGVSNRLGINLATTLGDDESDTDETTPPTVFCYSLIYVYYD